jgi:hypothetical protein
VLEEVGKSGTGVGLHSRHGIIKSLDESWDNSGVEGLLEIVGHVISELADSVSRSVSDLRVGVLEVLDEHGDHTFDLGSLIKVFTNLGESHNSSVFVSPVFVSHGVSDKLSNEGEHDLISDAGHKSVDTRLSELHVGVVLLFFESVAFLGSQPRLVNVFIDVNHDFENLLEDVLKDGVSLIFLDYRRSALNQSEDEFKRLVSDGVVGEVIALTDGLEASVEFVEGGLEKVGLNFSKLVEFNKGIFKDGLVILLESLSDDSGHLGKEGLERLGILAFADL